MAFPNFNRILFSFLLKAMRLVSWNSSKFKSYKNKPQSLVLQCLKWSKKLSSSAEYITGKFSHKLILLPNLWWSPYIFWISVIFSSKSMVLMGFCSSNSYFIFYFLTLLSLFLITYLCPLLRKLFWTSFLAASTTEVFFNSKLLLWP